MIESTSLFVEARTLNDVWREAMELCVLQGHDFIVEQGSYEGQIRRQLPFVTLKITHPGERPLAPTMPFGLPAPTSDQKIMEYFVRYLMYDECQPNELYTYGSFIRPQLNRAIELLKMSNGNTNQATITIGDTHSISLVDPPCLKVMSFKVIKGRLNLSVYFRSWDLFAGLPENLGGLQFVKEYVLSELGSSFEDGCIVAFSDGLHLYEQYFDLVNQLNLRGVSVEADVLKAKKKFKIEHSLV